MQNVSSQYVAGPTVVPYQQPDTSPNNASTTSSLRQFRKKDPSSSSMTNTSEKSVNEHHSESHVARVAPHNHYPPQRPPNHDYYRYHQQQQQQHYQTDYGIAPQPTKYQELGEHNIQATVIQKPPDKNKEFMEMCGIQQNRPYGEHLQQNGYGNEMIQNQMQYLQKDVQQIHHGYKADGHQYYQKDPNFQQIPHQMQKYAHLQPQMRKYPPQTNDFLSKLRRIHPDVARNILNEHQLQENTQGYPSVDQRPVYQNQRYYPGTMQGTPYPQQPYYPPYPPCNYGRPPQRPQPPRGVSGGPYGYPNHYVAPPTPEYAQHYQHRRPAYQPQPQQYMGGQLQQVAVSEAAESRVSPSDSLKKFIENWDAEEETEMVGNEAQEEREQNTETVYMINASELQYFGDNGLIESGVPIENCQYVIKGGVTIDNNTAMVRIIENSRENPNEKIVNLQVVEGTIKPDCMLEKKPDKKVVIHQNTVVQEAPQNKQTEYEEKILVDKNCSPINIEQLNEETQEEESRKTPKNMPIIDIFNEPDEVSQEDTSKTIKEEVKVEAEEAVQVKLEEENAPPKIEEESIENQKEEVENNPDALAPKEVEEETKEKSPTPDVNYRRTKRIFSVDDIINNIGNKSKATENDASSNVETSKDAEEKLEPQKTEENLESVKESEVEENNNNKVEFSEENSTKVVGNEEKEITEEIEINDVKEIIEESPNIIDTERSNNCEELTDVKIEDIEENVENKSPEIEEMETTDTIAKEIENMVEETEKNEKKIPEEIEDEASIEETKISEDLLVEPKEIEDTTTEKEENRVESPQNNEDIEENTENLITAENIECSSKKLEDESSPEKTETKQSSEAPEKPPDDVQYRNAIKIEENNVLLEISGVLVEITVNLVNGKKVLSVLPISNSTVVDFNDNYENFTFESVECDTDPLKDETNNNTDNNCVCDPLEISKEDTEVPVEEIEEEAPKIEEESIQQEKESNVDQKESEETHFSSVEEELQEEPEYEEETTQIDSVSSNIEPLEHIEEPTNEIEIIEENIAEEIQLEPSVIEESLKEVTEPVSTSIINEEIKKEPEEEPEVPSEETDVKKSPVICTKAAKKLYENELQIPAVTTSEDISKEKKNNSPPHQINDVSSSKEKVEKKDRVEQPPKKKIVKKSKRISDKQVIKEERKKLLKKLMIERREKKLKQDSKEEDEFVDFKELLRARKLKKIKKMQQEIQAQKQVEEKVEETVHTKEETEETKEQINEEKPSKEPTNTKPKSYRKRVDSEDTTSSDATKEKIEEKSPKKVTFSDITIVHSDNSTKQVASFPIISPRDPRKSTFYQVMVPSVSEMLTESEKASFRKKRKLSLEEYNSRKKSKTEEKNEDVTSQNEEVNEERVEDCVEIKKILPKLTDSNWEDSESPKHIQKPHQNNLMNFSGIFNKSTEYLKPKDDTLEAYKEQVDSKLSTLNINIPRVSKNVPNLPEFNANELIQKFLKNKKLSTDEMEYIRKIITYKRLIQTMKSPEVNSPKSSNYEVSKNSVEDTKLHLKKVPNKKPRFRNLNVDSSSDSSEEENNKKIDYSVVQSDSFESGVPKLIIKRKIEVPQPVVRLERLDVDVLKKRKCQ